MNWRNLVACGVLFVGSAQMLGDLCGNRILKGLGAATVIAPCPKVFSDLDGLEAFSSQFNIIAHGDPTISIPITPELYQRLKGPYNRRNVYGAAIAAAPRLPEAIRENVFDYAFRPSGPLRRELGLPQNITSIDIDVRNQSGRRDQHWCFSVRQ